MKKLEWIRETAMALNARDPVLAPHMRPILEPLHTNLQRHREVSPAREQAAEAYLAACCVAGVLRDCP